MGIYVGRSQHHAGNVALVLNPKTGLVSPQFHVVFDDDFTTVPHLRKGTVPPNWADLVRHSSEKTTSEFFDLTKTWFMAESDETADEIIASEGAPPHPHEGAIPPPSEGAIPPPSEGDLITSNHSDVPINHEGDDITMPEMINLHTAGLRRSPRLQEKEKNKKGMSFTSILTRMCVFGTILAACIQPTYVLSTGQLAVNSFIHRCNVVNSNFGGTLNAIPHMIFASGKENNECYTFKEMLSQPDKRDFLEAMLKESSEHEARNHWTVVRRSSMPEHTKPIQAIWLFKQKRFPDGSLNKHKARLCAHGGMQQWGVNFWETYAPVVNWISVRFLLILSEILGLDTQAIDFVLAFPQAKLDVPVYMFVPAGMKLTGIPDDAHHMYILKLERLLYGLKQASANWYDMLKKALGDRGFKESSSDPCVFLKQDMIVLVYVDDCILVGRNASIIADFIESLKKGPENFIFTDEGKLNKYLGVDIRRDSEEKGFTLMQPFLIERILQAADIDLRMTNSRSTPVVGPLLSKDIDGLERKHDWEYRTLTGMLGYLQQTSRPEI